MKNSFFAVSLATMLLPSAALGQQSQSEANAQTDTGPGIFTPLSDRVVGHASASHIGEAKVIVYRGSGLVNSLEVQPYFGIFMEDLDALAETCAEAGVASVPFNIRLETWRDTMEKEIIESLRKAIESLEKARMLSDKNKSEEDKPESYFVRQLGVYQLILEDSKTGRVLYKKNQTITRTYPSLLNFDGSKNSRIPGKDTPCALVREIASTPARLVPLVIVASDNATTEFGTVRISYELQQKLREELDKIENQQGLRQTGNDTLIDSVQTSKNLNTDFLIGSSVLGDVRQRFDSTNTTTLEDTRRRYIDLEGMKGFVRSSQTHIVNRSYCIRTTENDCSKNPEHLAEMILEILQTDRLQVFSKPPKDDFREAYILIKDRGAVGEAFSAGMKPYAETSQSAKMECGAALKLLEKAARVGAAVYTGGVSEVPAALADEKSKEGFCGNDRDMTVSDQNNVEWKYDGIEWVPTKMNVAYVSNDDISNVVYITNERTVSDGGISLDLMDIPLVLLDGRRYNDGRYNEMDTRIENLETLIRELLEERNQR